MNERGLPVGAAVFGLAAVGGLLLLSKRQTSLAPKVLGVRILPAKGLIPPYIEISLEPSPALARLAAQSETWEYKVAEATERAYLVVANCDEHMRTLRVPYVYGRTLVTPEVQVWREGIKRASTPMPSFPAPRVSPLAVHFGQAIQASHLSTAEEQDLIREDPECRGGIRFVPRGHLIKDELHP